MTAHTGAPIPIGHEPWTVENVLAEPPMGSPHWFSAVYARLRIISTGPIVQGAVQQEVMTGRLLDASVPHVAQDRPDLDAIRRECWPAHERLLDLNIGIGSPAPKLVFVSERDHQYRPIFWGRAGVWLLKALRSIGYDELSIYLVNAKDEDGVRRCEELIELYEAFAPCKAVWVGLGKATRRVLKKAKIKHLEAQHPSYHQKFEAKKGHEHYGHHLINSGLTLGKYHGGVALPVFDAPDARTWIADEFGLAKDVAYRPSSNGNGQHSGSLVDKSKAEAARRAYVLGEVATLKDAAALANAPYDGICATARAQHWDSEREEHLRQIREKAYREAADAEAKAIAACRKLAWSGAVKTLQQVNQMLDAGAHSVSTGDCSRLAGLAMQLGHLGSVDTEAEEMRLSRMTMQEVAEELGKTLKEQFGDSVLGESTKGF